MVKVGGLAVLILPPNSKYSLVVTASNTAPKRSLFGSIADCDEALVTQHSGQNVTLVIPRRTQPQASRRSWNTGSAVAVVSTDPHHSMRGPTSPIRTSSLRYPPSSPQKPLFHFNRFFVMPETSTSNKRDALDSVTEILEPKKARVDKKTTGTFLILSEDA